MKTVSMSGSLRANVGKKDAKALRVNGQVPCVIYGGNEQIHFSTDETSFREIIFTPETCYVEIELDGKKYVTIAQDIQYHKVSDSVLHADFFELNAQRPITLPIPLKFVGSSPGVLIGGKLVKGMRKIRVTALPCNMPEHVDVDISKLDVGQFIKVGQLTAKEYTFLERPSTTVVFVKSTRNVPAEETPSK